MAATSLTEQLDGDRISPLNGGRATLSGVRARPASTVTTIPEEGPTNGLDRFVAWDKLERSLDRGEFASQREFKDAVRQQFAEEGADFTLGLYRSVIRGLFPEYRDKYRALPGASTTKLTAEIVRDIRSRAANGERALYLAREYGVRHNTVSDLINLKSWRHVA